MAPQRQSVADRGGDDCLTSHDFEDVILLVDFREELAAEVAKESPELRDCVRSELARVVALATFE